MTATGTVPLHWETNGPDGAQVLVLLNAVGSNTQMWEPCVGPLAEQFRVIRIDTRGHGRSAAAPQGLRCSVADLGHDVLGALDRLHAARVHLAGLSLGGMVAMWLAAHHPERVGRLALLCTSAYLPPAQGWIDRAAAVRTGGMGAVAPAVLARWITPGLAGRDPNLMAELYAMFAGTDTESYAQCCEAIAAMDQRADLGRIAAPTLVIGAAHDPAVPPEHLQLIAAGIPGARLELLESAAHLATVELPGAVTALLLDHLNAQDTLIAGVDTRRAVLGEDQVDRSVVAPTELTAPFQDLLTRYAWGSVWSRPGLTHRDRSIATIAALVTLGAEHELVVHLKAALRAGLTPAEIGEVLLHTAVYAGLPRAHRAFTIAQQVIDGSVG